MTTDLKKPSCNLPVSLRIVAFLLFIAASPIVLLCLGVATHKDEWVAPRDGEFALAETFANTGAEARLAPDASRFACVQAATHRPGVASGGSVLELIGL